MFALRARLRFENVDEGRSHVVSHIDRVQLVGQEGVSQVHPLLLSSGIDRNHPGVHYDHHPYDEVVLLQDHVGDEGHQVQRLLLGATQLRHHHQQVGPSKHSTAENAEYIKVNDSSRRRQARVEEPHLSAILR